ncbi:MAG: hypothetical protein QXR42_09155 [Candidatus Bathyarchaeia archaeon]
MLSKLNVYVVIRRIWVFQASGNLLFWSSEAFHEVPGATADTVLTAYFR